MAPEMVILLTQKNGGNVAKYGPAVDWWSLGATIFKLLTGARPFSNDAFDSYVAMATTMIEQVIEHMNFSEYVKLFAKISYPAHLSQDAQDLIGRLLEVDQKNRLGSSPEGLDDIRKHPFFKDIDWHLLEQKALPPPFIPSIPDDSAEQACKFEEFMVREGKDSWLQDSALGTTSAFASW